MGYAEDAIRELHGGGSGSYSVPCRLDHINALGKEIVDVSVKAGWVPEDRVERREFGTLMALLHSEVSEALEEFRNGYGYTEIYYKATDNNGQIYHTIDPNEAADPKPEGIPIELADVAIRLFYTTAIYGIDLESAIRLKVDYNKTRAFKHGGKKV